MLLLVLVCGAPGWAQSLYEVTPYEVQVWVAAQQHPRVPATWQQSLAEELEQLAASRVGPAWSVRAEPVPADIYVEIMDGDEFGYERIEPFCQPRDLPLDKLVTVVIESNDAGYLLRVREYDLISRTWGDAAVGQLATADGLSQRVLALMCDVFVPVTRVERIEGQTVTVSVRASAMVRPDDSPRQWKVPVVVEASDILLPLMRRSDRNGVVGPDGVKPIEWTVLLVENKDQESPSDTPKLVQNRQLQCEFESGYRQPFSTRRSSRLEQYAIAVKPRESTTTLVLVNRKSPQDPLAGYEIYAKDPGEEKPQLLGRTDWQGRMVIERDPQQPVKVLLVRNGQQLLGKLPIVPGYVNRVVAPLRNDDLRLEAEGFLIGVQDSLVDLVARREVLASRIRRHIEAGELEAADELLKQLRQLDTQADFNRRVQQRKQSLLSAADDTVQAKIDQLFAQTQSLLGRYLSEEQVETLSQSIQKAKRQASGG